MSVVQLLSRVWLLETPWTAAHQVSLPFSISWSLLRFRFIESVMLSNHLIFCYPLLLLPSIFPSIRVFSNALALSIRWPKYWSFSIVLPMNAQGWFPLGLTGWISLLSKGLLRVFYSTTVWKASILWHSGFFTVQISHLNLTTGKTIFDYIDPCQQSDVSAFSYSV